MKKKQKQKLYFSGLAVLAILAVIIGAFVWQRAEAAETTKAALLDYIDCIEKGRYEEMYSMLTAQSRNDISKQEFISRNQKIYQGIGAHNMRLIVATDGNQGKNLNYTMKMDTVAGPIACDYTAEFEKEDGSWKICWTDALIFPNLTSTDRVKVNVEKGKRGTIYDRNGKLLAGEGSISVIGLVPKKMNTDTQADLQKLSQLLELPVETIEKKLQASWVKEDSFVPISKMKKPIVLPVDRPPTAEETLQQQLLTIPGVMITDETARFYPLGEKAAHLTGYVQNVSAEDLENMQDDTYTETSVIGKSGLEKIYEKRLHANDGYQITIADINGSEKTVIATKPKHDGEDLHTTIDADLQTRIYDQFQADKSASVAMNPTTGEVLALVSTPSYDSNDFVIGLSSKKWQSLNEDEKKPLYNRYRAVWCPGSSLKPIVAALGMSEGVIDPHENYGYEGLSWRKDSSWGSYHVTTLHDYGNNATLRNAIVYSDNIYFAKAALKFGEDRFTFGMKTVGFGEKIPFEIGLYSSQYANSDTIGSEIQLADSGYGQGQILMNPLHLAAIYSAFVNEGNMVQPYLEIKEGQQTECWLANVFSKESIATVVDAMEESIRNPEGTGHRAYSPDLALAGKTGTAEIKASKDDTSGTELGWFSVFTTDTAPENTLLLVSMVEDVKNIGGSTYVVKKDKAILDQTYAAIQ